MRTRCEYIQPARKDAFRFGVLVAGWPPDVPLLALHRAQHQAGLMDDMFDCFAPRREEVLGSHGNAERAPRRKNHEHGMAANISYINVLYVL